MLILVLNLMYEQSSDKRAQVMPVRCIFSLLSPKHIENTTAEDTHVHILQNRKKERKFGASRSVSRMFSKAYRILNGLGSALSRFLE